jgi:adenylate cyclase
MTLDKRAREIRSVFSSYVSRSVVDQLASDPTMAKIGGESRDVTILFLDVKGFTSFCEDLEPDEVVRILNIYLAALTKIIMEHDGTVDKFLGDGIMAYWGAPLAMEGHANAAVDCTLAMMEFSRKMAEKYRQAGEDSLTFRVGINSGVAIAGNIGLKGQKMEYTLIGDSVNLSSRIEGSGKFYGVDMVVSESTYLATRERFLYRELDCIKVVGKHRPVRIYELLAEKGGAGSAGIEARSHVFEEGLNAYRNRSWEAAYNIFDRICTEFPEDKPALIYRERCKEYAAEPPPDDWDFVFVHKIK